MESELRQSPHQRPAQICPGFVNQDQTLEMDTISSAIVQRDRLFSALLPAVYCRDRKTGPVDP